MSSMFDQATELIRQLPTEEVEALLRWISVDELERRNTEQAEEQAKLQVVTELQDSGQLARPEAASMEHLPQDVASIPEWKNPGTNHALMYRYGDVVRHNGKIVRSVHQGLNSWEPGELAFDGRIWELVETPAEEIPEEEGTATPAPGGSEEDGEEEDSVAEPEYKPFVQPTGSHDVYPKGAKVSYKGNNYVSTIDNNAWSPEEYPTGWAMI